MSANKLKLTYFPVKARAELTRLILVASKVEFEDVRISFEDFPSIKAKTPLGKIPILELTNGYIMNESMAIARYLARQYHLQGSSEMDVYRADRAACTLDDLLQKCFAIFHEDDKERKKILEEELKSKHLPKGLESVTIYLKETEGDFFLGKEPSYADLHLLNVLDHFEPEDYRNHHEVTKCINMLLEHFPEVKEYRERRPKTAV